MNLSAAVVLVDIESRFLKKVDLYACVVKTDTRLCN